MTNDILKKIADNIEHVIVGKRDVVEKVVLAFAAGGHVIIEDVPGTGKTTLASALAKSLDLSFNRIQFTPDILPSDIIGFSKYNKSNDQFEYVKGAVMSNIILADEINRTTPKTQSSLLEVMEEKQVTVDGKTHFLPKPFMIIATQNPLEYLGTFPLPEAQLDRFLMKVTVGYPNREQESYILSRFQKDNPLDKMKSVVSREELSLLQKKVTEVYVEKSIRDYIVDIVRATRNDPAVKLGTSPRSSLALLRASQAFAFYKERNYVIPDDVKHMASSVLSHRLILNKDFKLKKKSNEEII